MKENIPLLVLVAIAGLIAWSNYHGDFSFAPKPTISEFESHSMEGFIAAVGKVNAPSPPKPEPKPVECACHGTGKVKTGDGLSETECPCGKDCKCKKDNDKPDDNKIKPVVKKKRVLYFGDSQHCQWCDKMHNEVFTPLLKSKWTIGPKNTSDIQLFDWNDPNHQKVFQQYKIEAFPTLILLENEKETRRQVGYIDADNFINFYQKKPINRANSVKNMLQPTMVIEEPLFPVVHQPYYQSYPTYYCPNGNCGVSFGIGVRTW